MIESRLEKYCYIPEFILKNFSNLRGMLETGVYKFSKAEKTEEFLNPKNIKYGNYLFKLEVTKIIDKNERIFLNRCFEQNIENFENVIQKLNKHQQLSENDTDYMYLLFALLLMRTPEFRKLEWKDLVKKKVRLPEISYQRYSRICKIMCGRNRLNQDLLINALLQRLVKLNMFAYTSDGNFMINGFSPVLLRTNYYFPVSKDVCLVLTNEKIRDFYSEEDFALVIGSEMIKNDGPYVYGSKSLALKTFEKSNNIDNTKILLKRF